MTFRNVFEMLKPYRVRMAIIMGQAVIVAAISALTPFISRDMIDIGLLQGEIRIVVNLVLVLILLHVFGQFIEYLQRVQEINISNHLSKKLKAEAFEHGLKLKPRYFKEEGFFKTIGDALYDISSIMMIANNSVLTIFVIICKCLGAMVGLVILDWRLSIFVAALVPIKLWVNLVMKKRIEKNSKQLMDDNKDYNSWFSNILTGVVDIKLWNLEKKISAQCDEHVNTINESSKKLSLTEAKNQLLTMSWEFAWVQGLYIIGAYLIVGEQLTFGGLIAFITFANYALSPINIILAIRTILRQIAPSVEGLEKFYALEEENYAASLPVAGEILTIEFRDVSISFEGRDIISGLNLKINKGEKVAVVGDNGSGKTSIVNLLLRLDEPSNGELFINDVPIQDYNIEEYRKKFSVVSQGVHIFKGSVRENVELDADTPVNMDAQLEFCTEVIDNLENGLESQVGSDGAKLSGGERQKIALMRALNRKSSILVLDEPTSNYDRESDEKFNEFIRKDNNYDFYFIVTHRKDVLNSMDKVIEVNNRVAREVKRKNSSVNDGDSAV